MRIKRPISWATVLFFIGTTIAAAAWPVYAYFYGVTWLQVALAVGYFYGSGLAITLGYHRLLSHRTFKCREWVKGVILFVSTAAWQGPALEWCSDHVRHHAHIDTDDDPYNIQQGFWYAHMGWMVRGERFDPAHAPAFLTQDRLVMLQNRVYYPLAIFTAFIVPWAIAGVGGLLLVGGVRLVALHHTTWLINSWAHLGSHRPYSPDVSAVDNWFLAYLTFGEGFHNYHHAFPGDYRNGVAKWAFDPTKWLIWVMSKLGLAWDLKRISESIRWSRRIEALRGWQGPRRVREKVAASTRRGLEVRLERTKARLAKISERVRDLELPSAADFTELVPSAAEIGDWLPSAGDLAELRARVARAVATWHQRRDARRLARARRIEELLDRLVTYRTLLDRLSTMQVEPASA